MRPGILTLRPARGCSWAGPAVAPYPAQGSGGRPHVPAPQPVAA